VAGPVSEVHGGRVEPAPGRSVSLRPFGVSEAYPPGSPLSIISSVVLLSDADARRTFFSLFEEVAAAITLGDAHDRAGR
jgi:hypothetical protein